MENGDPKQGVGSAPGGDVGQLVGGVWLPRTETHLREWMLTSKRARTVDGLATYQYHKLEAAVKLCKPRRTALDIGGHCALWSMWLTKHFDFVQAIEPLPDHRELFVRNMETVGRENYALAPVAVGAEPGTVTIRRPKETTGNAHVMVSEARHPGTRHVENPDDAELFPGVEVITVDSMELDHVDLIKIDVEGFELPVVQGAEQTIKRCRPVMVVEQKGNDSGYGDGKDAASRLLQSWGMRVKANMAGDHILVWSS